MIYDFIISEKAEVTTSICYSGKTAILFLSTLVTAKFSTHFKVSIDLWS